jgi:hypothetical protein
MYNEAKTNMDTTKRIERAAKLLGAVMDGTVRNFGGMIYPLPYNDKLFNSIMFSSDLRDAILDVNNWLAKHKLKGRIERLDAGGSPEWGLV